MQKLRDLYKETQRNANEDFDKVTHERMKKILTYTNKQCETCASKNDFTNLDELTFYRQKFKAIVDTFNDSIQQGYKKSKIQAEIKNILIDNYIPQQASFKIPPVEELSKKEEKTNQKVAEVLPPKEVIQSYFQAKNSQINKSKIGFKSVLENIPYAPKKFPIKIQTQSKVAQPIASLPENAQEIKALRAEIDRLRKQLEEKDAQKSFNMQMLQVEKKQYEDRIQDLCKQVDALSTENFRLKEASERNYPIESAPQYAPTIYQEERMQDQERYNPYSIRYRENDINKIQNKQGKDLGFIRMGPQPAKTYNHPMREELNNSKSQSENLQLINELEKNMNQSKRKDNEEEILNTSFYKFNKSGVNNDTKIIAIKSKISFFTPSMIIHRAEDFQVAVKWVEITPLEVKRITVYINNKSALSKNVNIQYKFDPAYYQLNVTKKLSVVDHYSQGKEEIVVKFINTHDLDSLIEAKLTINGNEVLFLLPAMFLELLEKRPLFQKTSEYAIQKVTPIAQFSSLHSTGEYIPLEKLYGEHYESGRVYAISKNHEGYIYFRWEGGQIEIETIPAWRLFLSYLMLKEY